MSGFEIAGIVLATLPLLTPIVQNTIRSLSTRRYDQKLQELIRGLKNEQVNLRNVVEILLDGLVPPSHIQEMINNPMGDLWQNERTAINIRARLWDREALEAFETTIKSIKESVDDLHKKLQAHSGSKIPLLHRARLQFSDYEGKLRNIKDGIASLQTLTTDSVKNEPSRRMRSQGPFLTFVQAASQSLYRAVRSGLPCQSQCLHEVGIRLKHRKSTLSPHENEDEIMRSLEFEVTISGVVPSRATHAARSWQEILIKAAPATAPEKTKSTTTDARAENPPLLLPSRSTAFLTRLKSGLKSPKGPRATKTVNFGEFSPPSSVTAIGGSATGSLMDQEATLLRHPLAMKFSQPLKPEDGEIASLCKMGGDLQQPDARGILLDKTTRYTVLPLSIKTAGNVTRRSLMSLWEVLKQKESFFLSYRNRLQIAVTAASSILQLHGSPWLHNNTLSSHQIFIFTSSMTSDRDKSGLMVLGEELFLMRPDYLDAPASTSSVSANSFCAGAADLAEPPLSGILPLSGITASALNCNEALLSLGCLLLELMSKTGEAELFHFSSHLLSAGHGISSRAFLIQKYHAAQLALERYSLPSDNYRGAVSRCLEAHFLTAGQGLEREDVCQKVYSKVVALLERDLENT
ncbi:hypothetical protein OQA88_4252 [Cercophora sp. LCS_1]